MAPNKSAAQTLLQKKRPTVTLHDRTRGRRRSTLMNQTVDAVTLTQDAIQRVLMAVKKGAHSAHASGRETHLVIELTPRGASPDVDLVGVRAITEPGRGKPGATDALDAALAEARARGEQRVAEILTGPEMLSAEAFSRYIGVSREGIRLKLRRREVLGLSGAKRGIRYPQWQVTENGKLLPGLQELFDRLGGEPWSVYRFLLQHHPELGGETALAVLRKGEREPVLAAAENASRAFS